MNDSSPRLRPICCLLIAMLCATLSGCGQKGPLYLPGKAPESQSAPDETTEPQAPEPGTVNEAG